jgi:hypothetical protein
MSFRWSDLKVIAAAAVLGSFLGVIVGWVDHDAAGF